MSGPGQLRRSYRGRMGSRFASFTASYKESDLWIGVDPASYAREMEDWAASRVRSLRLELENYIAHRPEFLSSLVPLAPDSAAPPIAVSMLAASRSAGVGPMAAVAGAVAALVGEELLAEFGCREIVVENGGDLWLCFEEALDIAVFAGDSPLSEKVGVTIPPELSPLGLCTSSGTVGPSLSLGSADAAMVACQDCGRASSATLADAWATAVGNAVSGSEDIAAALDLVRDREGIVSVLVIKGARMGIRGRLSLKLF
jgi:uncharacterized protein